MPIGGSVESVDLGGREFTYAADAEVNRNMGGYRNEVEHNGDGSSRIIMTRTGWLLDGGNIQIDDDRGDQEYVESLIASKAFFDITITYVHGGVYSGKGTITGDAQASSQNTTMPVTLTGTGKLKKQ